LIVAATKSRNRAVPRAYWRDGREHSYRRNRRYHRNCSDLFAVRIEAEMTPKRPRDPNQLGKAIIDIATGERDDLPPNDKDAAAVKWGRLGGLKGGKARAEKLTPAERKASSLKAIRSRWPGASS
jgi:hypothetical protein